MSFRGVDLVFAPHVSGPTAGVTRIAGATQLGAGQTSLSLHVFSGPLHVISKIEVLPTWQPRGSGGSCRSFHNWIQWLGICNSFQSLLLYSICQASHWRPAQTEGEKVQISHKSHRQWTEYLFLNLSWPGSSCSLKVVSIWQVKTGNSLPLLYFHEHRWRWTSSYMVIGHLIHLFYEMPIHIFACLGLFIIFLINRSLLYNRNMTFNLVICIENCSLYTFFKIWLCFVFCCILTLCVCRDKYVCLFFNGLDFLCCFGKYQSPHNCTHV